ncbi:hypothetical protein VTK56DRAFT_5874 [Thermocarpiscus australiensis]
MYGIHEIYRPPSPLEPEVDIVAVHGLNGGALRTWTSPESGICRLNAPWRQHHRDYLLARLCVGHARRGRLRRPGAVRRVAEQQPAELPPQHGQLGPAPRGPLGLAGHRHRQQLPDQLAAQHPGRRRHVHAGHQRHHRRLQPRWSPSCALPIPGPKIIVRDTLLHPARPSSLHFA